MADDSSNSSNSSTRPQLHPVYTVGNIQNKVRVLDGVKVTYSNWVKLFRLHAIGYKVLNHIDLDDKPASTDSSYDSWVEIDAIVLQWIYGTLSDDLLSRVLESDTTARKAWVKIKNIFLNNKGSRAAALEQEFTNLTLSACSSMDEYYQKLKDLADQLGDVDNPVSGSRLVLQLVRGLPAEYDTVASFINQSSPSWDTARSMLQLEQHRLAARLKTSTTALVTPAADTDQTQQQQSSNRCRGKGRNNGGRGNRGGRGNAGGRGRSGQAAPQQPPAGYPPWAWWAPPPCPYPSQPPSWMPMQPQPWRSSTTAAPRATAHATVQGGNPNGFISNGPYDAMSPNDLGAAFQAMQMMLCPRMSYNDPTWYMDTGASNHITSDSGSQEWKDPVPPQ